MVFLCSQINNIWFVTKFSQLALKLTKLLASKPKLSHPYPVYPTEIVEIKTNSEKGTIKDCLNNAEIPEPVPISIQKFCSVPSDPGFTAGQAYTTSYAPSAMAERRGLGTGAAVGLGVGALAAGGLAGYALGGGFSSDSPTEEVQVASFSESADFGGDDWMD